MSRGSYMEPRLFTGNNQQKGNNTMAIFSKTPEADPLDVAVSKGRSVRGLLSSFVSDLDDSNALHGEVVAAEDAKIREANSRKEIAQQEMNLNSALAVNLRSALGLTDQPF